MKPNSVFSKHQIGGRKAMDIHAIEVCMLKRLVTYFNLLVTTFTHIEPKHQ